MFKIFVIIIVTSSNCFVWGLENDNDNIASKVGGHAPVESCNVDGLFDECIKYLDKNHTNYYYRVGCKISTLEAPQRVCLFTNIVDPANQDPYKTSAPVPKVNDGAYCEMRISGACYSVCTKIQSKLAHHDGKPIQFADGRTYVCNYPRFGGNDNKYVCGCSQSARPV